MEYEWGEIIPIGEPADTHRIRGISLKSDGDGNLYTDIIYDKYRGVKLHHRKPDWESGTYLLHNQGWELKPLHTIPKEGFENFTQLMKYKTP